uniref:Uncharacterized protein n=1 Tax=Oryza punctata TaxID=4537 RepID=A0A0E0KFE5_ORYPU
MRGSIAMNNFSMLLFRITSVITLRGDKATTDTKSDNQPHKHNHGGSNRALKRAEGDILAEGGDPLPLGLPAAVGRRGAPSPGFGRAGGSHASASAAAALLRLPLLRHLRPPRASPPSLSSLAASACCGCNLLFLLYREVQATTHRRPEVMAPHEMETESTAAKQAKESLELAFQMSQILDTGLDRHTLSLLMSLCDRGANPEALAALVRELSSAAPPTAATTPASNATATVVPSTKSASLFPSGSFLAATRSWLVSLRGIKHYDMDPSGDMGILTRDLIAGRKVLANLRKMLNLAVECFSDVEVACFPKEGVVAANPEALDALVRELSSAAAPTATAAAATTAASKATATPSAKSASLFPSGLR